MLSSCIVVEDCINYHDTRSERRDQNHRCSVEVIDARENLFLHFDEYLNSHKAGWMP